LADTAPDLAAAANKQRAKKGLPPLPYETVRPYASHGARGLLKIALDMDPDHPEYSAYRESFLEDYEQDMTTRSALFPGVSELLRNLKDHGYTWGIVTNKMEYLAMPLVVHLGLYTDCAVTVGGDTTEHIKPHPAPLLYAAEKAGFDPSDCIYIGDDQRDIIAGRAAGMSTMIAAYGYCGQETSALQAWQADAIAATAHDIFPLVRAWAQPAS
jgi:2-phosphoglycolate phosphatase